MPTELFSVQEINAVNVIELQLTDTLDSVEFDRLNESLLHLFDGRSSERWILDLGRVEYIGSAVLGLIVNIRQHVKNGRGVLILCGLSRTLNEILRASSLERLFTITKTRSDAFRLL